MSRILIIEDDKEISEIERDYLELDGFEADIANNGITGLEKALSGGYDLVFARPDLCPEWTASPYANGSARSWISPS